MQSVGPRGAPSLPGYTRLLLSPPLTSSLAVPLLMFISSSPAMPGLMLWGKPRKKEKVALVEGMSTSTS